MLEQLKTVNQSELVEYIGFVDNEYLLRKVNHGLKKALGSGIESGSYIGRSGKSDRYGAYQTCPTRLQLR